MKKILLALIGVVALVLLIAAIMPKEFKIEKEIVINKPREQVFNYLRMAKNANEWSTWMKKDPNVVQEFKGQDGTVGFINSWSGNKNVGAGEIETTNITPNERIDVELRFTKPRKVTNHAYYITQAIDKDQTRVIWGMTGRTPFPFNLICYFMHDKVGEEFQNGLNNLKAVLEK